MISGHYVLSIGEDAGKQCVAMILSALIYNKIKGKHSCYCSCPGKNYGDGNQYVTVIILTLSQCAGQLYIMQTELPPIRRDRYMSEKNNLPA